MFEPNQTSLSQLGYLLAEASKNVVFVVGAGLSKPAGIPLWPGLQDVLLQEAISYIEKSASLNSSQKDLKKRELHEITDMWMRGDLLEAAIPQEAYDRAIRNQLLHKLIPDPLEIYVLDFDLSWYEGALGKSMLAGTLNNYIAPEQLITRDPNASSRHTAVDVFGLGMLSFFGTTKTAPTLNIQNEEGFVEALVKKIRLAWSLPPGAARYIALTIQDATYSKQQNRCSMPTLIQRLQTIEAYLNDTKCEKDVFSLGIIEALLESGWDMHLDLNSLGNLRVKKTYVNITVKFDEIHPSNLIVNLQYSPTEEAPRGVATEKYIKPRIDRAEAILRKAGFGVEKYSYSAGATSLIAEFKKISRTQETCIAIGKAVLESAQSLQFG